MYKNILFATDLIKEHASLAEKAVAAAQRFKATLYLLHVIELPTSVQVAQGLGFTELAYPSKEDAQTVLSLLGEELEIPIKRQFVEIGSVYEQVLCKVKELDCQLIIIGSHSETGFPPFLGSTAKTIINHAPCDVLTLKTHISAD